MKKQEQKKKTTLTAKEKNRIAGARLQYILSIRNMKQVDLVNAILDNTDIYVSAEMMSMYLKGTKHIPQHIAVAFSQFLDIDPGYLLGLDGFLQNNNDYHVYCSVMEQKDVWMSIKDQADNYDKYLSHEGYAVQTIYRSKGKITSMKISDQKQNEYLLGIKDLNSYVKDISKYYKTRTKQLIKSALKEGDASD